MVDLITTSDLSSERRHKLGEALAEWFQNTIGLPSDTLFYDIAMKALANLQSVTDESQKAVLAAEMARNKLWAAERGLIYPKDYINKYSISVQDLRAAVNLEILKSEYAPGDGQSFWDKVITDRPLSFSELAIIANS